MAEYNFRKIVNESEQRLAVPVMTSPGMELIAATPTEVFRDGELQYRCIAALAEKTPAAAMVTFMDLSVEAEAFGSPIQYSEHENPTVTGRIVNGDADVERLRVPKVGEARTGETLRCAQLSARNLDQPVFGGIIGPFSLAGRLADMTEFMMMAMAEPDTAHKLLTKTAGFLKEYAQAVKAAGTAGIVIAEPAAGLLSPEMCQEFAADYVKPIVEAMQDENFLVILHNCGKSEKQIAQLLSAGAGALHLGNAVSLPELSGQVPADRLLMGNIDPVGRFKNGTPEEIYRDTYELLEAMRERPNFVLSSGCDVPPGTPMTNVEAFYRALSDWNNR